MTESLDVESPMLIALYGRTSPYPWIRDNKSGHDAYQLFNNLATALGWSRSTLNQPEPEGILWAMNDASAKLETTRGRLGWFQVSPSRPGRLLTIPLATCAWHTLARLGGTSIDGVQMYLPINKVDNDRQDLASSLAWFTAGNPDNAITVDIAYDLGEHQPPHDIEAEILRATDWTTDPFTLLAATDSSVQPELTPEVPVAVWMGSIRQPQLLSARLPEWTPEAVGWLAGLLTDGLRAAGVDSPALVSISRRQ